jgi:parallel beta-helix repeat protein
MKIDRERGSGIIILFLFLLLFTAFGLMINRFIDISAQISQGSTNNNNVTIPSRQIKKFNEYQTNKTADVRSPVGLASQSSNGLGLSECVNYDNHTRTINICSGNLSLTKVSSILKNPTILKRTSAKNWFLNANILIRGENATLFINSTDTDWLKINSTGGTAYSISVRSRGDLVIDHTKITSWNSTSNTVTNLKSATEPRRAFLVILPTGGHMNITNSVLSYLGYLTFPKSAGNNETGTTTGIEYHGGGGSIIKNNTMSFNHRGFDSSRVSNIKIENNRVYNNFQHGLDLHTGTESMKIYNNSIYNNGAHGIICFQWCKNILINKNIVYNNKGHGIDLDQLTSNLTVKNNIIYNNSYGGIAKWNSYNNIATNNVIYNNTIGIILTQNSHDNIIEGNTIKNSSRYGIYVYANSSKNKFVENIILNSGTNGIYLRDNNTKYNSFIENKVTGGKHIGIQFFNSSDNTLVDNTIYNNADYNYYSKSNSINNIIADTEFNNTILRFFDNSSNFLLKNTDNKITSNNKKIDNIVYPTNTTLLLNPTNKNIILDTLDMIVIPSSNHVNISSSANDFNTNQKYKRWSELAPDPSVRTKYIVGGFAPNTPIMIKVNGSFWNAYTSNSSGHISFIYDGGKVVRFEAEANNKPVMATIVLLASLTTGLVLFFMIKKRKEKIRRS